MTLSVEQPTTMKRIQHDQQCIKVMVLCISLLKQLISTKQRHTAAFIFVHFSLPQRRKRHLQEYLGTVAKCAHRYNKRISVDFFSLHFFLAWKEHRGCWTHLGDVDLDRLDLWERGTW